VLCFHHQTFTKYQNECYLDIDKYSGKRSKHSSVSNVTFVVVHKRKFLGLISRFPLSIIWKNQKRKATTYVLGNKHWLKESVAIWNRLVIWLIPFFNYVDDTCKQEVWYYDETLSLTLSEPGFFTFEKPGGLFRPRILIANNVSLDHGRNFKIWEKIALCMIFPTTYFSFLYLTWFDFTSQSPRCSQMPFESRAESECNTRGQF